MYKIVQAPNSILSNPTQPIDFSGEKLHKIVLEMKDTLLAQVDPKGVGLAGNQVNLTYQIFLARFSTKKNEPIRVYLNPEIIDKSNQTQPENEDDSKNSLEGCLSIPAFYGTVIRNKWVKLRFQEYNINTKNISDFKEETFSDFAAVVVQHEVDHLNGFIFVQRIVEQKGKLYRITGKDKKGKEVWEEVSI